MPPRSPLFDFGPRNFVCRSCRATLRHRAYLAIWPIRYSSNAAEAADSPKRNPRPSPIQDAERLKVLKTLGLAPEDEGVSINYFDEKKPGEFHRLQDEEEFSKALTGHKLTPFLDSIEEQLKGVIDLFKDAKATEEDDAPDQRQPSDRPSVADIFISEHELPNRLKMLLTKLNRCLIFCNRYDNVQDINPRRVTALWLSYRGANIVLSSRWDRVPRATWDLLWRILTAETDYNTNRMSHAFHLAKDMRDAGVPLSDQQQILAIEAMFLDGHREEAIKNHRKLVATLGTKEDIFMDFWQLGLRMYCLIGDTERAEQVLGTIAASSVKKDPRYVLPFIQLCAHAPTAVEHGFRMYRELRADLRDTITVEDYDLVISYFLSANHTEYALYVFVDMMKSGTVDLLRKPDLLPSVSNPFFFGKWMKMLIGKGDLDGAHQVLLFMRTKGVTCLPIHVNSLIGSWLRSERVENIGKAEAVAWDMINTRIQFVEMRERRSRTPGMRLAQSGNGWPRANLETFSLLAENYNQRGLHNEMEKLWTAFRQAELAPDSFMLNQLLISYLRRGRGQDVLGTFLGMNEQHGTKPDPWTFTTLWQSLSVNRMSRRSGRHTAGEQQCARELFAEMMKWRTVFRTKGPMTIDAFLGRTILHSFRKLDDKMGLMLAYRTLRKLYDFSPPDGLVLELMTGSSDLEKTAKGKQNQRLIHAQTILEEYLNRRQRETQAARDESFIREETGNLLDIVLDAGVQSLKYEDTRAKLLQVARTMGLYKETDDPTDT
ncbi:hypothetical protein F5Y15DRAFT_364962 [Xylariaceae sp. FL0016]|nr:hypothetical protein F5Y15DRAFT_364962 [Xylariaceae sp. FL0016]